MQRLWLKAEILWLTELLYKYDSAWHWAHSHDQLHESAVWQSTLKLTTADHVWIVCLFHPKVLSKENSIGGWRYFVVCGWNIYMLHTMHHGQEELGVSGDAWKFPLSWLKPMLKACLVSGKVLKVHTSWASSHLSRFSSDKRLLMIWTKFWRRETKEKKRRLAKCSIGWEGHGDVQGTCENQPCPKRALMVPFPKGPTVFHRPPPPRMLTAKQVLVRPFSKDLYFDFDIW